MIADVNQSTRLQISFLAHQAIAHPSFLPSMSLIDPFSPQQPKQQQEVWNRDRC